MINNKNNPGLPPLEMIEELSDAQLDQVNGGIGIPTLPGGGKLAGMKLGKALDKTTSFTKSDDSLPSNNGL